MSEPKSVTKRAFGLLYDEFEKISHMAHRSGNQDYASSGKVRMLYRWDRYLKKLNGVQRETLKDFLIDFQPKLRDDQFVAVDPSTKFYNRGGADGRVRMIVIDEILALKIAAFGLPDIREMKYKVPRDWEPE